MQHRTELLRESDQQRLKILEKECLAHNAQYKHWQCDETKMKLTRGANALYMHCLPADITGVSCTQGEVSKSVFEKYRLATYRQASYKPFIIAAIILLTRFKSAAVKLEEIIKQSQN